MKKYIKPTSESVSLYFEADVADLIVGSKTGNEEYSKRADFDDNWDDFEEEN